MSQNNTPRAIRRIETDNRILESALHFFGEKGYTQSSLSEIGKAAGVTGGLLTQRFGTKENLLKETFLRCMKKYDEFEFNTTDVINVFLSPLRLYKTAPEEYSAVSAFFKMIMASHDIPESIKKIPYDYYLQSNLHRALAEIPVEEDYPSLDNYGLILTYTLAAFNYIDNCITYGYEIPREEVFPHLIGYRDKNIDRDINKGRAIISAFSSVFYGLFYIYPQENRFDILKIPDFLKALNLDTRDAKTVFQKILSRRVKSPFDSQMADFSDINTIAERINDNVILSSDYIGSNGAWSRCSLFPVMRDADGRVTELILGIREISGKDEYNELLRKNNDLLL